MHYLPGNPRNGLNHSTQRSPVEEDFPNSNSADIDWYVRMPIDPPVVDLKDDIQHELCGGSRLPLRNQPILREEIAIFHTEMGRYVCWKVSNTMLVGKIQNATCLSGKEERKLYHPDYTNKP